MVQRDPHILEGFAMFTGKVKNAFKAHKKTLAHEIVCIRCNYDNASNETFSLLISNPI